MLAKKTRPIIGKLAGTPCSANRVWFSDSVMSPTIPLEYKIQSPRGLKSYDLGGIGLGIVAALEKPGNYSQIQANKAVFIQNLTRSSNPIPVKPTNNTKGCDRYGEDLKENEMCGWEDYTFVTCHGSNKSCTRVYCDSNGADNGRIVHEEIGYDWRSTKNYGFPVFDISPARFGEDRFTTSAFLNSCNLCHKKLHGKDIYMYRGDMGFCSTECRYRQIVMDERKEKCSSKASRSSTEVSNSPYTNGQIYTTGILAV